MELFLNLANVAIFALIIYGTAIHHRRMLHVKVMSLCFALDVALVLAVELLRGAVGKAVDTAAGDAGIENRTILMIHIGFSLLTLLMWGLQIYSGTKVLKNRMEYLGRHAKGAKVFLLMRFGNLVTAFMV